MSDTYYTQKIQNMRNFGKKKFYEMNITLKLS